MARPENIRTPLGKRLTQVRKELGYKSRKEFSSLFPIAADTLGTYERGVSEPNIMILTLYHMQFNINLNWLITGEGKMFNQNTYEPASLKKISVKTMKRISDLVTNGFDNAEQYLSPQLAIHETAKLYNELLERVVDISDDQEVEAVFPQLAVLLNRAIMQASSNFEK